MRDRRASFGQSLDVLAHARRHRLAPYTKSSIMLGLGESDGEVLAAMRALRRHEVDLLTLGQYLQPTPGHLPVREFVTPEAFDEYRRRGEQIGFRYVAAGPLVRSSYRAGELFVRSLTRDHADQPAQDRNNRGSARVIQAVEQL